MNATILPFKIEQTKVKLTDRGCLAIVDEFITGIGLEAQIKQTFPKPGSGRGTADLDPSVLESINSIKESTWKVFHARKDTFPTNREYAESIHVMEKSDHSFRLIVIREFVEQLPLFAGIDHGVNGYARYKYYCIITNIDHEEMNGQKVIWHHNGRGNAECYIEDGKYGLNLRYLPCGQFNANTIYYAIGILAYNLIKLMQISVLPVHWQKSTILTIKRYLFRLVAKVVRKSRIQILKLNKSLEELKEFMYVREKIYALS